MSKILPDWLQQLADSCTDQERQSLRVNEMSNYKSATGSTAKVKSVGKRFEIIIDFPESPSGRIPAEQKVIKCNAWSGVEKQLKKWNLEDA